MTQETITYAILLVVIIVVLRHLWKFIKPPKDDTPAPCQGCPLMDVCKKKEKSDDCQTSRK